MPAIFAGTTFASSTYVAIHLLGHFNLVHAWVIPLAALAWIRCDDHPCRPPDASRPRELSPRRPTATTTTWSMRDVRDRLVYLAPLAPRVAGQRFPRSERGACHTRLSRDRGNPCDCRHWGPSNEAGRNLVIKPEPHRRPVDPVTRVARMRCRCGQSCPVERRNGVAGSGGAGLRTDSRSPFDIRCDWAFHIWRVDVTPAALANRGQGGSTGDPGAEEILCTRGTWRTDARRVCTPGNRCQNMASVGVDAGAPSCCRDWRSGDRRRDG